MEYYTNFTHVGQNNRNSNINPIFLPSGDDSTSSSDLDNYCAGFIVLGLGTLSGSGGLPYVPIIIRRRGARITKCFG